MPITTSANKALRQAKKRTAGNKIYRSKLKHIVDTIRTSKDKTKLPQAYRIVDRAVKKHVIHSNKGARIKSQLTKLTTNSK